MAKESARINGRMTNPWIVAHRGASGHAPENTLAAFQKAVEMGALFIETDVHLTRDARFVTIHDATLERTTDGHGTVREFTLLELRQLDAGRWFGAGFAEQRIPTLEEILAFGQEHDVVFYLEIKYQTAWGMHHALAAALQKPENAARTIVISFEADTLLALRRLNPYIMLGMLVDKAGGNLVDLARDAGARQLCPRSDLVTPELVAQAKRADMQVVTWTVNDPAEMRRLMDAGVNGIMTDFPDRLRAVIEGK